MIADVWQVWLLSCMKVFPWNLLTQSNPSFRSLSARFNIYGMHFKQLPPSTCRQEISKYRILALAELHGFISHGYCHLKSNIYRGLRLLEELSFATTLQGVLFIFCRYMFRPLLAIFRRNTQWFQEATSTTMDPLFFLWGPIYSIFVVVYLIRVCELFKFSQIFRNRFDI
jgi:hypothetical protein